MMNTSDIAVEFADGSRLLRPDRDELTAAVAERISDANPWLCVTRGGPGGDLYVQAYRHGPDDWQVEHRFGSAGEHYEAVEPQTRAVTERLLRAWTGAEPGWRDTIAWRRLDFPARQVPVAHEPHARTRWIGTHAGGRFFGDVTGARGLEGVMALLHRFDADGNHVASEFRPAPDTEAAERELASLLAGLDGVTYGPIRIRPFAVEAHGVRWGLIDLTAEMDGREHYELMPQYLGFGAPFDGLYST
ncbi:hypothetical protein [Kitasatospora sp. NPDC093558]|uniref:hypothetical protein n=1 Tax=Kitasatospora sp. NPDC093558 TaxID=3155201 RepID=UPI003432FA3C